MTKPNSTAWVTAGILLGLILSASEQTIVAAAMPTVMKDLGGLSLYSWAFSVYMLASTTMMPIYGKLADLFGRKRVFLAGLLLFLIGSALCGMAGDMTQLVVYRLLQGMGAGALMPVAFTIAGDLFPPERRGKFMGLFGTVIAVSSIVGPTLGGLIVEYWHWRWIFYINLPIGAAAVAIIAIAFKENGASVKRSIDWWGAMTLSGAIISILLALVSGPTAEGRGGETGLLPWPAWLGFGAVLTALFLWIETKAKEPIIPLFLFRVREIAFGSVSSFFVSAGLFGAITFMPLYAQAVLGLGASAAGYVLVPLMLSVVVTSTLSGRWMNRYSFRSILIPSLAVMAAGFLLLGTMSSDTPLAFVWFYMAVTGLGMGAVYPVLGTAAQTAAEAGHRGVATASSQFFRSMGSMLGVSVLGGLLTHSLSTGLRELASVHAAVSPELAARLAKPEALLDAEARAALPPELLAPLQTLLGEALNLVFLVGFAFVLISLLAGLFLGKARLVALSPAKSASAPANSTGARDV